MYMTLPRYMFKNCEVCMGCGTSTQAQRHHTDSGYRIFFVNLAFYQRPRLNDILSDAV